MNGLMVHTGGELIGRQDLLALPTPLPTETHKPVPHYQIVEALIQSLAYRHLDVVEEQYAIAKDGARMFGVLALSVEGNGIRVALGLRNSHDKSFSLALTCGYKVFVCDNLAFNGDFKPVLRKHSKNFDPTEVIDIAVGKMQRSFEPMMRRVDAWREHSLPDAQAKLLIYRAFIEDELEAPKHLARVVHQQYFEPTEDEFKPRTLWSLSNAFTGAFKELEPVSRFKATGNLATFMEQVAP